MASKSTTLDPVKRLTALSEKLRNRQGIDWNVAKFELPRESTRIEFFRGRDFERYFLAHEELLDTYTDKSSSKSVEERMADLGSRLLKNGIIVKAQRKFKKPKPGKPRLVKWPRTLLPCQKMEGWERDVFYVWKLDRPTSAFTYIIGGLVIMTIIAGCLLPIAPYIIKLGVFYISLTMLMLIAGVILGRTFVWLVVWMVTGNDFWILPNILSDDIAIKEAFVPIVSFSKVKGPRSKLIFRALSGAVLAGFCWFLLAHNPGGKVVRERAKEAHDTLLDMLSIKKQIAGNNQTNKTEL